MAQRHCNFTTNCHQVSAKAKKSRRMKTSTTITQPGPRMNRISSRILFELPQLPRVLGVLWYLKYPLCLIWLFEDCFVCFLSVSDCYHVRVFVFGFSSLKTLWCVKPRIGILSKMCFPSHYLCQLK
jgi:hypothetical protein